MVRQVVIPFISIVESSFRVKPDRPGTVRRVDQPRPWTEHTDGAPFNLPEPGTLVGAWASTLSDDPNRPLLHGSWGAGGTRWVGRREVLDHTVRLAGRLLAAGVEAGDRVLVSGPSSVDLAADIGAPLLGSIPLDGAVTDGGDTGRPVALGDGPAAEAYQAMVEVLVTEAVPPIDMAGCTARLLAAAEDALDAADAL